MTINTNTRGRQRNGRNLTDAAARDPYTRWRRRNPTPLRDGEPNKRHPVKRRCRRPFLIRDQVTTMDTNTAFGGCSATSAAGNLSGGPTHKEVSGSLPSDWLGPAALDCYSRRTRLPAGLTETELMAAYEWCRIGGAS